MSSGRPSKPKSNSKKVTSDDDLAPECKYGTSCYRKNPEHFKEFRHPHLDNKDEDEDEDENDEKEEEEEDEEDPQNEDEGEEDVGAQSARRINIYLESPDGTQYWDGSCTRHSACYAWGPVGYESESSMDINGKKFRTKFESLVAEKKQAGWIHKNDPRNPDTCDKEQVYLISTHDPLHLPGFTYFKLMRCGHVVHSEYGTFAESPHTFQKWYSTIALARAVYERFLHKKLALGFKHAEEPTFQGRGMMCAPDCPYKSNEEHNKYYHHMDRDIAAQFEKAQAACRNPVLVDAWNTMKLQLITTLQQHTPDHMHPVAELIADYCEPDMHACWKPILVKQKDVPITRSKIGGRPYLERNEEWPCCGECKKPMEMWLQLNVSELPAEVQPAIGKPDDLIQLFTCFDDDCSCRRHADEIFDKGHVVRRVKWTNDAGQPTVGVPMWANKPMTEPLETMIIGWEQHSDYVSLDNDNWFPKHQLKRVWLMEYEEFMTPMNGDKLCGFPLFIQTPEYPICRKCYPPVPWGKSRYDPRLNYVSVQQRMRYLFSISAKHHFDSYSVDEEDVAVGQIYYCHKHPDVLGWVYQAD